MYGERAEPRACKNRGEIAGTVWQPQRHPRASSDAGFAEPGGGTQDAPLKSPPVQCARRIGYKRSRRIAAGPRQKVGQRARIIGSIKRPHRPKSVTGLRAAL